MTANHTSGRSRSIRTKALLGLAVILGTGASVLPASQAFTASAAPASAAATTAVTMQQSMAVYNQFQKYLKNASKTPYSLIQARNYLLNRIKLTDSWRATVMVLQLENALKARLPVFSEKLYPEYVQKAIDSAYRQNNTPAGLTYSSLSAAIKDEKVLAVLKESFGYGYKLETSEGMYYPVLNYEAFKSFKPYIGKDIAAYIDLMAAESNKPALSDGAIIISWDELIARALKMESFVKSYPSSNRTAAVKNMLDLRTAFVFYGADNTPAYQYGEQGEPTKIDPELLAAYQAAVKNGAGDSGILKGIESLLGLLEKSGGRWSTEIEAYLKAYQYSPDT